MCAVVCRLFPAAAERVCGLGDDGRITLHCFHLAHVYDVAGPLLYAALSHQLRTQSDSNERWTEDRLRLGGLDRRLRRAGCRWLRRLLQRLRRRAVRPGCQGLRPVRVDPCLLRPARHNDRHICTDSANIGREPTSHGVDCTTHGRWR